MGSRAIDQPGRASDVPYPASALETILMRIHKFLKTFDDFRLSRKTLEIVIEKFVHWLTMHYVLPTCVT